MRVDVEIIEKDGYVAAVLSGVRTPKTLVEAALRTTSFCSARGISRVLIDLTGTSGRLDTLETYEVAGHDLPRQKAVRRFLRSAILDRPENIERIRFFETVAVNRGLNVKVFADEKKAIQWLLGDPGGGASLGDHD